MFKLLSPCYHQECCPNIPPLHSCMTSSKFMFANSICFFLVVARVCIVYFIHFVTLSAMNSWVTLSIGVIFFLILFWIFHFWSTYQHLGIRFTFCHLCCWFFLFISLPALHSWTTSLTRLSLAWQILSPSAPSCHVMCEIDLEEPYWLHRKIYLGRNMNTSPAYSLTSASSFDLFSLALTAPTIITMLIILQIVKGFLIQIAFLRYCWHSRQRHRTLFNFICLTKSWLLEA